MEKRRKIPLLVAQGLIIVCFVILAAGSASSRDAAVAAKAFGSGALEGFERRTNGFVAVGIASNASECIELCKSKGYEEWSLSLESSWCYCK